MFIVLTSKINEYEAMPERGIEVVKAFDYWFYNQKKSVFTIARVDSSDARVRIVEAGKTGTVNSIPVKFFEKYTSVAEAEAELIHLTEADSENIRLQTQSAV